mmetsp:Transcript_20926/g.27049  ORF Transcript_20926/g.27049 Transcript_20926/m.27049 type:complete len:86 (+) Transcript_20926:1420-1677(+)
MISVSAEVVEERSVPPRGMPNFDDDDDEVTSDAVVVKPLFEKVDTKANEGTANKMERRDLIMLYFILLFPQERNNETGRSMIWIQ